MLQYYNKDTCTLTLPWDFDSPLVDLPEDTKVIIFDENSCERRYSKFNQPINKGSLPNSLTHLTTGQHFNQPIDEGSLPDSITHLTFGWEFNQPINKDSLPDSITHLTFGFWFNQSVENLPNSLLYLSFWSRNIINNIPLSVSTVKIKFFGDDKCNIENLPSSIKKIIVNNIKKIGFIKKIPFGCEIVEEKY